MGNMDDDFTTRAANFRKGETWKGETWRGDFECTETGTQLKDDLDSLLRNLNIMEEVAAKKAYTPSDARLAYRRHLARQSGEAHRIALERTDGKLDYSSTPHVVGLFFGLLTDLHWTAYDEVKGFMNTPEYRGLVEEIKESIRGEQFKSSGLAQKLGIENVGTAYSKLQDLGINFDQNGNVQFHGDMKTHVENVKKAYRDLESYHASVANVANREGVSVDEVFKSPTLHRDAIMGYTTLDEHIANGVKTIKMLDSAVKKGSKDNALVTAVMAVTGVYAAKALSDQPLEEFGLNTDRLVNAATQYTTDIAQYTLEYLHGLTMVQARELQVLKNA